MPKATGLHECRAFADSVRACGGTVPKQLECLLSAHELLAAPGPSESPDRAIIDAALNGTLDERTLDKLLPGAATAAMILDHRRQIAQTCEHTLVGEWHRQLAAGGADAVLSSLQKNFDTHAKAIAHARSLIDPESSLEHIMASASPEVVTAWQTLSQHVQVIDRIAAIASHFGPRPTASFPQFTEYVGASEGTVVDNRAVFCTAGGLVADSALFRRPSGIHRDSPWARTALQLHSVASARDRYRAFCADQFDAANAGPRGGWVDVKTGEVHEHPLPPNPFRQEASA
jgi:hypothetical protein